MNAPRGVEFKLRALCISTLNECVRSATHSVVPNGQDVGWALEPVQTWCGKKNSQTCRESNHGLLWNILRRQHRIIRILVNVALEKLKRICLERKNSRPSDSWFPDSASYSPQLQATSLFSRWCECRHSLSGLPLGELPIAFVQSDLKPFPLPCLLNALLMRYVSAAALPVLSFLMVSVFVSVTQVRFSGVPTSNLGCDTDYPEILLVIPQSLHVNAVVMPQIRP